MLVTFTSTELLCDKCRRAIEWGDEYYFIRFAAGNTADLHPKCIIQEYGQAALDYGLVRTFKNVIAAEKYIARKETRPR